MSGPDPAVIADFLYFLEMRYDSARNTREGDLVWKLGNIEPGDRVLDVACGWGRMGRYLVEHGADVVGIDISPAMIAAAKASAPQAEYHVRDMRDLSGLGQFDVALIWWSSFGYFDDETDRAILRQVAGLLRPGGRLLVETINGPVLYQEAAANPGGKTMAMTRDNNVMIDHRQMNPDGRRIVGARTMYRGGRVTEYPYDVRIFTPAELEYWMLTSGFKQVELFDRRGNDLMMTSYGMVAVGTV
ncbi:SAM-dependent methyltransferase [Dactylosporangium sp. CA-139114]|uniref:SAM-dependent methyltransferase n=1 Tax=Dactylosporangium sp. CA-139114 TaxID=3239931 RepID=UPI003D96D818